MLFFKKTAEAKIATQNVSQNVTTPIIQANNLTSKGVETFQKKQEAITLFDCGILSVCVFLCTLALLLIYIFRKEKIVFAKARGLEPSKKLSINETSLVLFVFLLAVVFFSIFFFNIKPNHPAKILMTPEFLYCIGASYVCFLFSFHKITYKLINVIRCGVETYVNFSFIFLTEEKIKKNGEVYEKNKKIFNCMGLFLFGAFGVAVCLISRCYS